MLRSYFPYNAGKDLHLTYRYSYGYISFSPDIAGITFCVQPIMLCEFLRNYYASTYFATALLIIKRSATGVPTPRADNLGIDHHQYAPLYYCLTRHLFSPNVLIAVRVYLFDNYILSHLNYFVKTFF